MVQRIQVIDSHTGGEPTRIIVDGGPNLGEGPLAKRLVKFRDEYDAIRSAVVCEPRGSDVLVGGLLCKPVDPSCSAGIIFFNVAGFLGMCGHGTIGLMETLSHLGKVGPGIHKIETPVGLITTELFDDGSVKVINVPAYRLHANVSIEVPNYGAVVGDVAWGGNWFFLAKQTPVVEKLVVENWRHLTSVSIAIRDALSEADVTGEAGAYVDHIELFGPPVDSKNDSRNFVLCPGGAYDRSPCGTGTSAKLACLAADGKLAEGEIWNQESIIGSVFHCSYSNVALSQESDQRKPSHEKQIAQVVPAIRGRAHVTGEVTLILNAEDPFCMGITESIGEEK